MKILVLNSPSNIQEILAYLPASTEIVAGTYAQIEIVILQNVLTVMFDGKDIAEFDYVWVTGSWSKRDIAKVISLYLHEKKRKFTVVNEGDGASKLVDIALFALNKLPQPNTYYAYRKLLMTQIDKVIEVCGLPIIGKSTKGSRGKRSFLATTRKEFRELIKKTPSHVPMMFQEFIENDFDWGIVVAQGKCVSAEQSFRAEDATTFLNHAYLGATEVFTDTSKLPTQIANIAQEAHRVTNLTWGRADIVHSSKNGQPYLLEVNRSPRMTSSSPEVEAFGTYLANEVSA
jgi:glutathione synthase/RimK-type ligase-like ATP-grasp enzyme